MARTMKEKSEAEWRAVLEREGFRNIAVWPDIAGTQYPPHTHPYITAHVILKGEMTLTVGDEARALKPGDRCDVPRDAMHEATIGSGGCTYLVGEK